MVVEIKICPESRSCEARKKRKHSAPRNSSRETQDSGSHPLHAYFSPLDGGRNLARLCIAKHLESVEEEGKISEIPIPLVWAEQWRVRKKPVRLTTSKAGPLAGGEESSNGASERRSTGNSGLNLRSCHSSLRPVRPVGEEKRQNQNKQLGGVPTRRGIGQAVGNDDGRGEKESNRTKQSKNVTTTERV